MAYTCPRCGGSVRRGSSGGAAAVGGLVGAMVFSAFGAFECEACGKIPRSEFPPEVRRKMTISSALMLVGALAILAVVVVILVNLG